MLCRVVTCFEYYMLYSVVTCYIELLHDVQCCSMLQRVITCCAMLLHVESRC